MLIFLGSVSFFCSLVVGGEETTFIACVHSVDPTPIQVFISSPYCNPYLEARVFGGCRCWNMYSCIHNVDPTSFIVVIFLCQHVKYNYGCYLTITLSLNIIDHT